MAGTFILRTDELLARIGDGPLDSKLGVDQVYARYQHEGLHFRHPRGGQAKYLEQPLYAQAPAYMQKLADKAYTNIRKAAIDNAEDLSKQVERHAPVEFDHLRRSGNPVVVDNGAVIYNRPPVVRRLSEEELRAKSRSRRGRRRR